MENKKSNIPLIIAIIVILVLICVVVVLLLQNKSKEDNEVNTTTTKEVESKLLKINTLDDYLKLTDSKTSDVLVIKDNTFKKSTRYRL